MGLVSKPDGFRGLISEATAEPGWLPPAAFGSGAAPDALRLPPLQLASQRSCAACSSAAGAAGRPAVALDRGRLGVEYGVL